MARWNEDVEQSARLSDEALIGRTRSGELTEAAPPPTAVERNVCAALAVADGPSLLPDAPAGKRFENGSQRPSRIKRFFVFEDGSPHIFRCGYCVAVLSNVLGIIVAAYNYDSTVNQFGPVKDVIFNEVVIDIIWSFYELMPFYVLFIWHGIVIKKERRLAGPIQNGGHFLRLP